jgi:hypothetical protein
MLIWGALIFATWIVLSIPVAVVVGRMFAAGHAAAPQGGGAPAELSRSGDLGCRADVRGVHPADRRVRETASSTVA